MERFLLRFAISCQMAYLDREEFVPLRRDEEEDTFCSAIQRHSADQQGDQHHVRENSGEVGHFTRRFHTFYERHAD